eukprot:1024013_1
MGCLCCKSNKPVSNDTTNTALLNEPNVTRITTTFSNETNALLHVTAETDEVKPPPHIHDPHHTLPKLIPDIRQLQMIIFQAINYNDDYNLYPKHAVQFIPHNCIVHEWSQCCISSKHPLIIGLFHPYSLQYC